MGQEMSTHRAAEKHALQGWPSFMTGTDLRLQMAKFRVRRSVLGRRVRLFDRVDGCIEYARLSKIPDRAAQYYQRVDSPCLQRASVPKFPHSLAAHELPGGASVPYTVTVRRANYCELADASTKQCATYRRSGQGAWIKVAEQCRETRHDLEVELQRRQLQLQGDEQRIRDVLGGKTRAKKK